MKVFEIINDLASLKLAHLVWQNFGGNQANLFRRHSLSFGAAYFMAEFCVGPGYGGIGILALHAIMKVLGLKHRKSKPEIVPRNRKSRGVNISAKAQRLRTPWSTPERLNTEQGRNSPGKRGGRP